MKRREIGGKRPEKKEIGNWRRKAMGAVKIDSCDKNSLRAVEISPAELPAKLHAILQADLPPP
jgi:hypothetical protein